MGLDGLRAISVGLVILLHASSSKGFPQYGALLSLGAYGGFGVTIFFVISGFLISWLLLAEEGRFGEFSRKEFYLRRIIRIIPPAYVYLCVIGAISFFSSLGISKQELLSSALFFRNLTGGSIFTGHYWSLAIEEQFYILWPIVLVIIPREKRVLAIVLLCLGAPVWRQVNILTYGSAALNWWRADLRYDSILSGALLACVRQEFRLRDWFLRGARHANLILVLSVSFLFASFVVESYRPSGFVSALFIVMRNLCVCLVIFSLVDGEQVYVRFLLDSKPLIYIGYLSYSLYIWQQFFCAGEPSHWYRTFPVNVLMAVAAAILSYNLVERPFMKVRELLRRRRTLLTVADKRFECVALFGTASGAENHN